MREKKKDILEYVLKKDMFIKSLEQIYPFIIQRSRKINVKSPLFIVYGDLINKIKQFKNENEIDYSLSFFFCLLLGDEYSKIVNNDSLLQSTIESMKNEKSWDENNISLEVAIYFSYTFLNELYKDIAVDIYLLSKDADPANYLKNLRNEII